MTEWTGPPPILHLHVPSPLVSDERNLLSLRRVIHETFGATLHLRPTPEPVFDLTLWGPWAHSPSQVQSMIAPLVDAVFHEKHPLDDRSTPACAVASK